MAVQKVNKNPLLKDNEFTVVEVKELNYFDLLGTKSATSGTSNKSYHAEIQISKTDDRCQIYTIWGATGAPNQTREWRHYSDRASADKDFKAIIKSKISKGYREIDVAQRALGSEEAKAIVKPVTLKNADALPQQQTCSLPLPTQNLITHLFGATSQFVATTLKCPLGQLSNAQIDRGRDILNRAKTILNTASGNLGKTQLNDLQDLTNEFYGEIPHNLGQGARGKMTHLLLDNIQKVVQKESDLDTLLDAKSVGAVLNANASIDAKYQELNADLTWIDPNDPIWKFMSSYFHGTKISGHGYHSAKLKNLWRMERKDRESEFFIENSNRIAKECGQNLFVKESKDLVRNSEQWDVKKRPDLDQQTTDLFARSNTWLCWHGTRSANVVGITKRGLLIRPAGAIHTGSMFGDGKYFSQLSSKSLNYTDGGYWTGGRTSNNSRFMFLLDATFGNMYLAPGPHFYRNPPKGNHSVYGKAHKSGVQNDEIITYDFEQKQAQSRIRYLLEI